MTLKTLPWFLLVAACAMIAVLSVALQTRPTERKPIPLLTMQHELAGRGYLPDARFDSLQEGPAFNIRCSGYSTDLNIKLGTTARMIGFEVISWCRTVAR